MGKGRPPHCKICGRKLDAGTAYKVTTYNSKGTPSNAFYCSQEEYEGKAVVKTTDKKQSDPYKGKAYSIICNIIGRSTIKNTALWKEWALWNQETSNDVIAKYLEENQEYLSGVISRLDNVEFARIRYLSAILKNNLRDYKLKVKPSPQPIIMSQDEHYQTKFKCRPRVALEDLEEECYE